MPLEKDKSTFISVINEKRQPTVHSILLVLSPTFPTENPREYHTRAPHISRYTPSKNLQGDLLDGDPHCATQIQAIYPGIERVDLCLFLPILLNNKIIEMKGKHPIHLLDIAQQHRLAERLSKRDRV